MQAETINIFSRQPEWMLLNSGAVQSDHHRSYFHHFNENHVLNSATSQMTYHPHTWTWLRNTSSEVRDNRNVVLAAVKRNGRELKWASANLKDDVEVALVAVAQNGMALADVSKARRIHRDIVLTAVKQNGLALEFAGWKLRNDKEIVMAAVQQNGLALEYATRKLRNNKDLIVIAINQTLRGEHNSKIPMFA